MFSLCYERTAVMSYELRVLSVVFHDSQFSTYELLWIMGLKAVIFQGHANQGGSNNFKIPVNSLQNVWKSSLH